MSVRGVCAFGVVVLTFSALGCRPDVPEEQPEAAPEPAAPAVTPPPAQGKKLYGAPISKGEPADLSDVLKDPERFRGKSLILSGHVRRACTRKGCWMELSASKDPATPACRVTFHGYGFFVPKDSAGSDARVEGRIDVVRVSAAHAAHLEEEGARVADKGEDGSAREVHLVASGVELFRRGG